jgi:hypothetical protein
VKISSFLEENFGLSISENTTQISGAIFRGGRELFMTSLMTGHMRSDSGKKET